MTTTGDTEELPKMMPEEIERLTDDDPEQLVSRLIAEAQNQGPLPAMTLEEYHRLKGLPVCEPYDPSANDRYSARGASAAAAVGLFNDGVLSPGLLSQLKKRKLDTYGLAVLAMCEAWGGELAWWKHETAVKKLAIVRKCIAPASVTEQMPMVAAIAEELLDEDVDPWTPEGRTAWSTPQENRDLCWAAATALRMMAADCVGAAEFEELLRLSSDSAIIDHAMGIIALGALLPIEGRPHAEVGRMLQQFLDSVRRDPKMIGCTIVEAARTVHPDIPWLESIISGTRFVSITHQWSQHSSGIKGEAIGPHCY